MKFVAILAATVIEKIEAEDYKSAVEAAQIFADSLSEKTGIHYVVEQVQNE